MLKKQLAPGLIAYEFEPLSRHRFGTNMYALVSEENALLIDSGYAFQGEQAFEDIKECGWNISGVIISHFHDDHMEGLKLLPGVTVYGSERYAETLDMWTEKEEHHFYVPTEKITDKTAIRFGKHDITMIPFPGHSPCTILTMIDGRYLHIADELLFSIEGEPVLPMTDPGCIQRHADALHKLKEYDSYVLLPSHGPVMSGSDSIRRDIDNRLSYYNAILNAGRNISYEEAVKDCSKGFLHSEWHMNIYE